ncbi:MAG: glycosyltransferase family 4 protein [Deltaproteobacteria bacterium]|nr:glycosyltransferase family 4 protein [Deltaproteobacteria bacterium]
MKPRILVIVDVPGWALERTADNVMQRLSGRYDFSKAFNSTAVETVSRRDYDLVYICYERQFQDAGIGVELPRPSVIGVRCHSKWDGGCGLPPSREFLQHLNSFDALHVPSRLLQGIFAPLHPAVFYTPHGVDETVFAPRPAGRLSSPRGSLVLGWAGSRTNHPAKRGLDDLLIPAVKALPGVELRIAAREDRWRTQAEMVKFYQGLDACICTSRVEGGPHSLLEASACAVPVISTRVGIAPELICHGSNGLLIDRSIEAIREAVTQLRDRPDLRAAMAAHARKAVEQAWTWDKQALKYIPFFDYALAQGHGR